MAVRDKNAIRQEIIGVARNFFIKNGVDATSMEAIAVANGVSKPTIYEYFTNKTDLIQAVVESAVRDVDGSLLKSASQGEISFEEYLDRLLADCFEAVTSETRSVLPKLIVMDGPRSSEMARTLRALRASRGVHRNQPDHRVAAYPGAAWCDRFENGV